MIRDISYLLYWDDDTIPIIGNVTLGNYLENDIMVPGEDVLDYHARIDLNDRGPVVIPLGQATLSINGRETDKATQLVPGDILGIGQATLQIGMEVELAAEVESWSLHASHGLTEHPLAGDLTIGRASSCDICIADDHISRVHARILEKNGFVWLQDKNSANGTRINDVPLRGGTRLFHGDVIAFDRVEYQLIGHGGDLTPIVSTVEPHRGTSVELPAQKSAEATQIVTADTGEQSALQSSAPELSDTGAFLLGVSESVDGNVYRIGVGETLIGRSENCQIVLDDPTVSLEHASIKLRPEGAVITDLMSTNATKVNGEQITSANLRDGDVVRFGKVTLMFKDVPAGSIDDYPALRRLSTWILIGAVAAAALLIGLLLL